VLGALDVDAGRLIGGIEREGFLEAEEGVFELTGPVASDAALSRREARFTESPMAVYSMRRVEPTVIEGPQASEYFTTPA
jgi:hypothetical protein